MAAHQVHTLPKGDYVKRYPAGAVSFPQFPYPLPGKNKRHPLALIANDTEKRAAQAVQKRSKKKVVGNDPVAGGGTLGSIMVSLRHTEPFRGFFI